MWYAIYHIAAHKSRCGEKAARKEIMMSTMQSFVPSLGSASTWKSQGRSAVATFSGSVSLYWEALRDGLAASRRYQELMVRGVEHKVAVRQIFDEHFAGN